MASRLPVLRRLGLGLAVAASTLAAAELALRVLVPKDSLLFAWERSDAVMQVSGTGPTEARLLPRPSSARTTQDGPHAWRTAINGQGFRDDAETEASAPGRYRVLAIGDSWVFGVSTDQEHTFAERLERELGTIDGRPVEVVNAGVPSFSAFDMLVRFHDAVQWLEVDALLVGVPHNAAVQRARAELRTRWYQGLRAGPSADLRLYLLLRLGLARHRSVPYATGLDGDGALDGLADLRALLQAGLARGLATTLVAWPNRWEGGRSSTASLRTWSGLPGVLAAPGLAQRSCYGFVDEGHPSEAGAAAAAVHVADVMRSGRADRAWAQHPSCDDNDAIGPGKAAGPRPLTALPPAPR